MPIKYAKNNPVNPQNSIAVVLMAAGRGKRMGTSLPKVLHPLGGRPMISHVLEAVNAALPSASVAIVVGHGKEQVEAAIRTEEKAWSLDLHTVEQADPKGTGDAVRCAMNSRWGKMMREQQRNVLVLPGDLPLITPELVSEMSALLAKNTALRLLTCEVADPTGYGRIVRQGKSGPVQRIVEEKDANDRQRRICEVGASIYLFESKFLAEQLPKITSNNAQGEYYLTDLVAMASKFRKKTEVLRWEDSSDVRGVNDLIELTQASRLLNERWVRHWALRGVLFIDPARTDLESSVQLDRDVVISPNVLLQGSTQIGEGTVIGPGCVLKNVKIGARCQIKAGSIAEDSVIGDETSVGPYAHLRPGSTLEKNCKIGNFVELKNTRVGQKTSIAHLSYLGDADVGARVNIGCGFVTCNFDGRVIDGSRKHRTVIEDEVFMGSDCQAIAPIRIGRGSYVASGSTLTQDVEADALAIARSRQVTKPGYGKRLKER